MNRIPRRLLLIALIAAAVVSLASCRLLAQGSTAPAVGAVRMAVPQKARPLPIADVRVTGGPLKRAQDLNGAYLLELDPDRMMAFLRKSAGLQPKAEGYGGWDGPGRQLTGHLAGHYLSGVSLMWAATGDPRFKERADYLVRELKAVQDAQGDGYIGAQTDRDGVAGKVRFEELSKGIIRSGGFDLNGLWSPWYVEHKIFAGLRDAYRYAGSAAALDVEIKLAAWAEGILSKLDAGQIQRMLATEFGGMNEVLADLYADTGDRRWLALSDRFEHTAVIEPLARREDILAGKHGNTLVPKLFGSLVRYTHTGNPMDGAAAKFFWDQVALHHSFATGGHGRNEYFGPPDNLNDMIEGRTGETCNVYNMIKMARALFALDPDMRYADFHERALFNHILGSMDPGDGATCYMVPVGQGVSREYQNMQQSFTCCVGSGMESHALHGDGLYYEAGDRLWVNLFVPSTATWKAAGVGLTMSTTFPDGEAAALSFTAKTPKAFTLVLRRPYWAGDRFSVKVNGVVVPKLPAPGTYVELRRTWKSGDTVDLVLPKALRLEPLPDNAGRAALMWGPLVLAGDLGPVQRRGRSEAGGPPAPAPMIPVFVTEDKSPARWLKPVEGAPGRFRSDGVGRDRDVEFQPFYSLQRRTYGAYWDLFTPSEWQLREAAVRAAEARQRQLEAATVAFVQPGQMQTERDFNQQGGGSTLAQLQGRYGRRATDWFSFDVPVDAAHPLMLVVTYSRDERANRAFEVLVDGVKVGEQAIPRRSPQEREGFFDAEYPIPANLVTGKQKVTVRFQGTGGSEVAAVYGIRMVRADQAR
jgi:hypothetical protein